MRPDDYLIGFKSGARVRVPKEVGDNLEFNQIFKAAGKQFYFDQADFLYLVPALREGGQEGIIEPKSPKQVKADKERKENNVVDKLYGLTTEEKAIS